MTCWRILLLLFLGTLYAPAFADDACKKADEEEGGPMAVGFSSGIYELAGHKDGKPYYGSAMITHKCPYVMHRCVNGVYSKGPMSKTSFWLPADPAVTGIQFKRDDNKETIKYRVFVDLDNYAILLGYDETQHGSEHLLFTEADEFRCGDLCIPTDNWFAYDKETKPCR